MSFCIPRSKKMFNFADKIYDWHPHSQQISPLLSASIARSNDKKERVLRYRIIYEERTYLSWRGVVGRAERKGPRLNKREYHGVNVACMRRSHVTPIDILSSIISFANLTFLSLLRGKHIVWSYGTEEIEFRNIHFCRNKFLCLYSVYYIGFPILINSCKYDMQSWKVSKKISRNICVYFIDGSEEKGFKIFFRYFYKLSFLYNLVALKRQIMTSMSYIPLPVVN